jgi:hypothetical protein
MHRLFVHESLHERDVRLARAIEQARIRRDAGASGPSRRMRARIGWWLVAAGRRLIPVRNDLGFYGPSRPRLP